MRATNTQATRDGYKAARGGHISDAIAHPLFAAAWLGVVILASACGRTTTDPGCPNPLSASCATNSAGTGGSGGSGCVYGGDQYAAGDVFGADDGCNTCACGSDGEVSCTLTDCFDPGVQCYYGPYVYLPGDSFTADDGCNTCSCDKDGSVYCTEIGCVDPGDGCYYGSAYYSVGETFSPDGCNTCFCNMGGQVSCTDADCQPVKGCYMGDTLFAPGQSVICPDGCNSCDCQDNGNWLTTEIGCGPTTQVSYCDVPPQPNDGLLVAPIYLSGNSLALNVKYGGGCVTHDFTLCFDGSFQESNPVQSRVWLVDSAGQSDDCDAVITEQKVFDLSALRDSYLQAYSTNSGQITVRVGSDSVLYSF